MCSTAEMRHCVAETETRDPRLRHGVESAVLPGAPQQPAVMD
ncbi:hypothetical protein I547_3350 [Mycobacterium kansasii 824]|uniref:Uncharacterized protein n=1 Tax=Mycobacterium kansasii TaxID=1768 RepID=A0A1V3XM60_MYCKA|nr:hypothetical protein I547_3350 [Mycobacterium kansasii 824]OOK80285.1 hypothetical protein BZL29_2788 [Mycobacterium kansasii]